MVMVLLSTIMFITGLALLIKGSDILTDHSSNLAKKLGVSQLVIGITLVAFSTSLPELAVSIISSLFNVTEIATGTIIGSNIANIGLILGTSSLLLPLISKKEFLHEGYFTLIFTLVVSFFLFVGMGWYAGITIIVMTILYIQNLLKRKSVKKTRKKTKNVKKNIFKHILFSLIGTVMIITGAHILVNSTVELSRFFRVPELVISILFIAVGTSLPELSTSVVAAVKKMRGISIGNILGSNIFNITILGITSLLKPIPVTPHVIFIDIPVMIGITLLLLAFMRTGWKISRAEGFVLLCVYAVFVLTQQFSL
ncbi:sodium:calcium antiporter [Candidatus Aerophobetes bacterium]|uniref:Sodium:calcium antiporter n=1 Tax=Aerophobetes bacterium TaxID=2030807 RepID=A0A662D749_UNCAE|nr:MAG: sodium:calcium antiporter [Candidatus Aerophobetes bacterium]